MITQEQARQIFILASNYANYEAAASSSELIASCSPKDACYHEENSAKYSRMSSETWLKLKELVDGLTEE